VTAFIRLGKNYAVTEQEFERGAMSARQAEEAGFDSFTMDYGNGDLNYAVFIQPRTSQIRRPCHL
jgi:hypothetical protein